MTEDDYISASNLARLRLLSELLSQMIPTKQLPKESIESFQKWTYRMLDKHFGLVGK